MQIKTSNSMVFVNLQISFVEGNFVSETLIIVYIEYNYPYD